MSSEVYKPSQRSLIIQPFQVMEIMEEAMRLEKEGAKVIHMEVGESDLRTPEIVCRAANKALECGKTRYTHSLGLPQLREAVADHYRRKYSVAVDADQVVITSGTSPAMLLAFSVLLNPGDEAVLTNPGYACYPNFVNFVDGVPVYVDVYESEGYQLPAQRFKKALSPRTRAVLINSPANPTGAILEPETLKEIADAAPFILSDEIYHGLVYEGGEHSILEYTDRAIVFNGFSKLHAMTGWRLGYLIAPQELVRPIQKLQQNFFISPNAFVQWAGVAALNEAQAEVAEMVNIFNERRQHTLKQLAELGFTLSYKPEGAFYVLINARHLGKDSMSLARDILEKVHLAVTPGVDFGSNAEGYLRLAYTTSIENITEGMQRLKNYIAGEAPGPYN
jgi:aspartate/methionine/tyrosine aminotransferase